MGKLWGAPLQAQGGGTAIRKSFFALAAWLMLAYALSAPAVASTAAPAEEQVTLVVSKKRHTLTVYVNETPVRTFRVATGKGNLTPEGEFTIANKIVNPWYLPKKIPGGDKRNPFGTRWLGLAVPNTGGYRYGIHGTNRPHSIGYSVSSGCIRMRNPDVEWLYRHIPVGTPVTIQ
ncbi:L,D-transpeptidase [Paenibacillus sp.]|uniref:L,D-transpeptidase n=1 Tax=Paenibacillus sp. TaxID=58172 RepID=UPI002D44E0DB|nr:L,D-transpeptidase [Paenibacillus sp.]HZG56328.1 L,D-transpeptidase [Paenibacillus sp.]